MKKEVMHPLIVGILLMAIGASAKAINDVSVLKANYKNVLEHLILIREDLKEVKHNIKRK